MSLIINSFAKNLMNLAQRYPYGGRWANHRIEHGKKNDFHMGCSARRETISFGFSLQIRVFLKAQKKKIIYGALINIAKWKKKKIQWVQWRRKIMCMRAEVILWAWDIYIKDKFEDFSKDKFFECYN